MTAPRFTVCDASQRSDAWRVARAGRATASRAADILAKVKSGGYSTSRRNYLTQLVAERLTGQPQEDGFVSAAMQRGLDLEAQALATYESITGEVVRRVGFLAATDCLVGASPDGVIGDFVGLLELKVPLPATHLEYLEARVLPSAYRAQVTHQLLVSGAAYCDFMSYCPNFPERWQTVIVRVKAGDVDLEAHRREVGIFLAEIDLKMQALETMGDLRTVLMETAR